MGTLLVLLVGGLLGLLLLIAGCLVVGSLGAVWFYAYVICRSLNRQFGD
jgi:NAD/NADP transhydrogenase beta subunit